MKSLKIAIKIIMVFILFVFTNFAYSQVRWNSDGIPISEADSPEDSQQIVSDGLGGVIVTWVDHRNGNGDIYAQRIDRFGNMLWDANGILVCTNSQDQQTPLIVADGNGGAIITWTDDRNYNYNHYYSDVYAQRIDKNGNCLWQTDGVEVFSEYSNQVPKSIVCDELQGAYIMVWNDGDYYVQRLNSNGEIMWNRKGVAISMSIENQWDAKMVRDGYGNVIIVFETDYGNIAALNAQKIDLDGYRKWGNNGLIIITGRRGFKPFDATYDNKDGVIVVWEDERYTFQTDIYTQRININGQLQWSTKGVPITTASNYQTDPKVICDRMGNSVVVWADRSSGNYEFYAQKLDIKGNKLWDYGGYHVVTTNQSFNLNEDRFNLTYDNREGAIVVWYSNSDIFAQHINSNGSFLWDISGLVVCNYNGYQRNVRIINDEFGGVFVTWTDNRNWSTKKTDIYGQLVNDNAINLISPKGGEYFAGGSIHEIKWETWSETPIEHIVLFYSTDGGSSYPYLIVENINNNGSYEWMIPTLDLSTVRIKVQVHIPVQTCHPIR